MRKYILPLLTVLFIMTGCTDLSTSTSLKGLWYQSMEYCDRCQVYEVDRVYEFINSNTVKSYGNVTQDRYAWSNREVVGVPGMSGFYYAATNLKNLTYYKDGNKVYLTNGDIFTINGDILLIDGSSATLKRWNK